MSGKKLTDADFLRICREEHERLEAKYEEALRVQRVLGNAVLAIAQGRVADPVGVAARAYLECWPDSKDVP